MSESLWAKCSSCRQSGGRCVCMCVWAGRLSKQYLWEVCLSTLLWKQTTPQSQWLMTINIYISHYMCCGSVPCVFSARTQVEGEALIWEMSYLSQREKNKRLSQTMHLLPKLPLESGLAGVCSPSIGQRHSRAKPNNEAWSAHHLQEGWAGHLSGSGNPYQGSAQQSVNNNSGPQQGLITAKIVDL